MKANKWIEFNIYPELSSVNARAKAVVINNEISVKLLFKAPKGYYQGYIEDANTEAIRLFGKTN